MRWTMSLTIVGGKKTLEYKSSEKLHEYDVVIGPIADDKVGVQLFRYMKDYIDLATLLKKLRYIRITAQYYFGTERAVRLLRRL